MPLANLLKRNSKLFAAARFRTQPNHGDRMKTGACPSTMIRCRVSTD
jgi:hypothetical protein